MKGYQYKDWMTREERRRFVRNIEIQDRVSAELWLTHKFESFNSFIKGFLSMPLKGDRIYYPFDWYISVEGSNYWYKISQRTKPLK